MKQKFFLGCLLLAFIFHTWSECFGVEKPVRIAPEIKSTPNLSLLKESKHAMVGGYEFLLQSQLPNGSWINEPAVTSLVVYSFLLHPTYNPDERTEKAIKRGLEFIETFVRPDGSISGKEYVHYNTAICLLALTESNLEKYSDIIRKAKAYLIRSQVDEEEGIPRTHPQYGGIGYGGDDRVDLSNTQFALDAIKAAEDYEQRYKKILPAKVEQVEQEQAELGLHWQKALVFLARCQNLKAVNDMPYAIDDGGFIYETGHYNKPDRNHSYGSMTYAGVKSLLHARVSKDDIRVKQAVSWIKGHYTLEENPGFGKAALYFYYMTFAKCLDALGEDVIVDDHGKQHYWREELLRKLISLQKGEGYWVSEDGQYWHNVKALVTAYAVIGMKFALKGII